MFNFFWNFQYIVQIFILGLDGRDGIPGEPGLDGVPGACIFMYIYISFDWMIEALRTKRKTKIRGWNIHSTVLHRSSLLWKQNGESPTHFRVETSKEKISQIWID